MAVNRYYSSTAVDTTLAVGISNASTSMTVSSTTGFPTSYPYTLAIDYDTSKEELVNIINASGTTLTIGVVAGGTGDITGRGVDQGAGYRVAHDAGAVVKHVISGRDVREPQEHIAATTSVHGIADTSTLVTTSSISSLTNKTLDNTNTLAATTVTSLTANSLTITGTELGYLDGATSNLQTQINNVGNWQDYTTTWSYSGSTAWNYGSGSTATARYTQIGKTVHFKAKIVLGTSPSIGTGTATFTLPVNPNDAFVNVSGYYQGSVATLDVAARLTSGSNVASVTAITTNAYTLSSTAYARFGGTVNAALSAHGITPASGDVIFISGTYEAA